jgi:hypothetical protein
MYFFYLVEKTLQVFVTYLTDALYCTLHDSTDINTIIEFVRSMSAAMVSIALLFLRMELSDCGYFPNLVRNRDPNLPSTAHRT